MINSEKYKLLYNVICYMLFFVYRYIIDDI